MKMKNKEKIKNQPCGADTGGHYLQSSAMSLIVDSNIHNKSRNQWNDTYKILKEKAFSLSSYIYSILNKLYKNIMQ